MYTRCVCFSIETLCTCTSVCFFRCLLVSLGASVCLSVYPFQYPFSSIDVFQSCYLRELCQTRFSSLSLLSIPFTSDMRHVAVSDKRQSRKFPLDVITIESTVCSTSKMGLKTFLCIPSVLSRNFYD